MGQLYLQNRNYVTSILNFIDSCLYNIWFKLWFEFLDNGLSFLVLTTPEKNDNTRLLYVHNIFKFLLWLKLTIIMTPLAVPVYVIWFLVFRKLLRNKPFNFKTNNQTFDESSDENKNINKTFQVLSINVCLLPETLSKVNNLHSAHIRLESIAHILTESKNRPHCCHLSQSENCLRKFFQQNDSKSKQIVNNNSNNGLNDNTTNASSHSSNFEVNIIDDFVNRTNFDFLCMQEVWSIETSKKLSDLLSKKFKYILYDVGESSFKMNKYVGFDSGLLFASKYPILNADFRQYNTKAGTCLLTGKGFLMVKVCLGSENGKNLIGFVSNTHLQAYQGKLFLIQIRL
jgi:hypothetical protein